MTPERAALVYAKLARSCASALRAHAETHKGDLPSSVCLRLVLSADVLDALAALRAAPDPLQHRVVENRQGTNPPPRTAKPKDFVPPGQGYPPLPEPLPPPPAPPPAERETPAEPSLTEQERTAQLAVLWEVFGAQWSAVLLREDPLKVIQAKIAGLRTGTADAAAPPDDALASITATFEGLVAMGRSRADAYAAIIRALNAALAEVQ